MSFQQQKTAGFIAGAVLLVALFVVWWTIRPTGGSINLAPYNGVGQVLAEEVAKAIHDHGHVLAVITADHQRLGTAQQAEWEAFRRELQAHPSVILDSPETVAPDLSEPDITACPMANLKKILERPGQADAIVFFVRLPAWHWLADRQWTPQPTTGQIIVLDKLVANPTLQYDQYFQRKIINLLIIGWGGSTGQVARPKTPHEWFEKEYQLYTPQNFESLPDPAHLKTPLP